MNRGDNPGSSLRRSIRRHWFLGFTVVAVCFFGTGYWASNAELSSAAIASGKVSPDGSLRIIQHLEGGIVRQLNIKEGDLVHKGDVLLVLDKALAMANYLSTYRKYQRFVVTRDRLLAQERGDESFEVAISEDMASDRSYRQFVSNEMLKFKVRRELLANQRSTYHVQTRQVESEIDSLKAQVGGIGQQIKLLDQELANKRELRKKGLIREPELLALERKRAELWSEQNAIGSTIARARQKIEEIKIAELTSLSEEQEKTAKELSEINAEIAQSEEAISATTDILKRTDIVSPVEGRVLKVNYKTVGGVVRPGEPIVTIVPEKEELILDTRLGTSDIDNVIIGMTAKVQLTSFMGRHMKPLTGEVFQVGADAETDDKTGELFYTVRVRVTSEDINESNGDLELVPGMPAQIFIQTGSHTPMRYFLDPLMKSFDRAFREERL
ncbi:HlyD family type I secretion periplasmic adaptor subunit [Roseibium sp.]|uniref:HlyD family type I secretion periplasmic adaptor subunit n=1 Tax=Roseibium sp. TaxID=1936156 RepID=UPI003A968D1E